VTWWANIRNPVAFIGRIVVSALSVVAVSVAYLGVRERSQTQALDRINLVLWMEFLPAFLCVGAVPLFSHEYSCFRKEVKNGLYRPFPYFIANTCVNIPFWFVLALISMLDGFYGDAVFNLKTVASALLVLANALLVLAKV
jgi:hypothetical protein